MNNCINSSKNNILIIFDEIENISPRTAAATHWREGMDVIRFWHIIRSYIQAESKGRLTVCLVGTNPHLLETPRIQNIDNPVYLFAKKRYIPNLSYDETKSMVERLGYYMGLDFPPEQVTDLQRAFGGHPFFTRQLCSKIHNIVPFERPTIVSRKVMDGARIDFSGDLVSYLRNIIDYIKINYPDEFSLLISLSNGDKETFNEFGYSIPELVDHLIGYGLVEHNSSEFVLRSDSISAALKQMFPPKEIENYRAEISERRNKIEIEIRQNLFFESKSFDGITWNDIVTNCLSQTRRDSLLSTEPRHLFSSSSHLYFSDLLCFIKDSRIFTHLGARRSDILSAMDKVNRYRIDAHGKTLSDTEMVELRKAFDVLESEFVVD